MLGIDDKRLKNIAVSDDEINKAMEDLNAAVKTETGRKSFHETTVDAERLDPASKSANRAGRQKNEKPLSSNVNAPVLGDFGVRAHLANGVAARGAVKHELGPDR